MHEKGAAGPEVLCRSKNTIGSCAATIRGASTVEQLELFLVLAGRLGAVLDDAREVVAEPSPVEVAVEVAAARRQPAQVAGEAPELAA